MKCDVCKQEKPSPAEQEVFVQWTLYESSTEITVCAECQCCTACHESFTDDQNILWQAITGFMHQRCYMIYCNIEKLFREPLTVSVECEDPH